MVSVFAGLVMPVYKEQRTRKTPEKQNNEMISGKSTMAGIRSAEKPEIVQDKFF
jgi:hypothetical protein